MFQLGQTIHWSGHSKHGYIIQIAYSFMSSRKMLCIWTLDSYDSISRHRLQDVHICHTSAHILTFTNEKIKFAMDTLQIEQSNNVQGKQQNLPKIQHTRSTKLTLNDNNDNRFDKKLK